MKHIMLDLETMGLGPNAAIVAIGAVAFDPDLMVVTNSFSCNIDLESSVKSGGIIDPGTVKWWLQQDKDAQEAFQSGLLRTMIRALNDFSEWVGYRGEPKDICMWGNGVLADNLWLGSAYDRMHTPRPWSYKGDMDYRTVRAMYKHIKADTYPEGIRHRAVDDARYQANHLMKIMAEIRGSSYAWGDDNSCV